MMWDESEWETDYDKDFEDEDDGEIEGEDPSFPIVRNCPCCGEEISPSQWTERWTDADMEYFECPECHVLFGVKAELAL